MYIQVKSHSLKYPLGVLEHSPCESVESIVYPFVIHWQHTRIQISPYALQHYQHLKVLILRMLSNITQEDSDFSLCFWTLSRASVFHFGQSRDTLFSVVLLLFIPLITKDIKCLFMCIFAMNISYVLMCPTFFSNFQLLVILNFNSSLYIINTSPISNICFVYTVYFLVYYVDLFFNYKF